MQNRRPLCGTALLKSPLKGNSKQAISQGGEEMEVFPLGFYGLK